MVNPKALAKYLEVLKTSLLTKVKPKSIAVPITPTTPKRKNLKISSLVMSNTNMRAKVILSVDFLFCEHRILHRTSYI